MTGSDWILIIEGIFVIAVILWVIMSIKNYKPKPVEPPK